MIVNQNFKKLMEYTELSERKIAAKITQISKKKITHLTLNNIITKKDWDFKVSTLQALATTFPDLNFNWLLKNEGPMFEKKDLTTAQEPEGKYEKKKEVHPECLNNCPEMQERIRELNKAMDVIISDNEEFKKIIDKKLLD